MSSQIWRALFPGLARAADLTAPQDPKTLLPARSSYAGYVDERRALSLSSVYRAVQILADSITQLPLDVERNGQTVPGRDVPSIIKQLSLTMDNQEFLEYMVFSLALHGNGYAIATRDAAGNVVDFTPVPPRSVAINRNEKTGAITYSYKAKTYPAADVIHVHRMRLPGSLYGLGPIQAAMKEVAGHIQTSEYGSSYFDSHALPQGILTSEQALRPEDAAAAKEQWYAADDMADIRVLGKGLKFEALSLSPKEVQWIEAQQFSVVQIARLFGVPSSLMLAVLDGNSQTYSNVEQDWLAFTRFTLMGYVRKLENALTAYTVRGQKVRLRVEGLLRSDTKSRYAGYEIAIRSRFMTVDEVREIEGLPPLTPAQIEQIKTLENGASNEPVPTDGAADQNA